MMDVVKVDLNQRGSAAFKKYVKHFPGGGIPYSVVLDSQGKAVHQMRGFRSYGELVKETSKFK